MVIEKEKDISTIDALLSVGVEKKNVDTTAQAITEWFNSDKSEDKRKSAKQKVTVGTAFHDTFSKAGFTEVCLIVADFDITEALRLYHQEDFRLVLASFRLRTRLKMAEAVTMHEAMGAVFGGGSEDSDATVVDVTQGFSGVISG